MATRVKLDTKGFGEFLEAIAAMGKDVDLIAGEMLRAGGEVLLDGMQRRVPVGKAPHDPYPGNLKAHLNIDGPYRDGNFHYILVGLNHADADTARYGNVQEYSSATCAAQPYVRPTLDEDKKKAADAMKKVAMERGLP